MVQETALGAFYGLGCIPCPFVIQGVSGAFERRQLWLHYRTGRPVGRWRLASPLAGALHNVARVPSFGWKRPSAAFSWPCGGIYSLDVEKRRHRAPLG